VRGSNGKAIFFTEGSIDPLLRFVGTGAENVAPVLWLTLLPVDQAGDYQPGTRKYNWTNGLSASGRRWRSLKTVLSPAGRDLTANEHLEFWALVDTSRDRALAYARRIRSGDVKHDPKGGTCPSWCDLWTMCRVERA